MVWRFVSRVRVVLTLAAFASLGGACTTVLYKGPARPASEIAVLTSRDAMINKVDSLTVGDNTTGNAARYEVLPGKHEVGISLNKTIPGFFYNTIQRSNYIVVCVELEAGHVYRAQPMIEERRWVPMVIDETTRTLVDLECDDDEEQRPVAPVRIPPTVSAASEGDASPPLAATADAGAPLDDASAPTAMALAPPADAPPPALPAAVDREVPRRRSRVVAAAAGDGSPQAEASGRRPGSGLSLFIGYALGGEDLATARGANGSEETLSAGKGVMVGIGGMVTPWWPSENLGLGVALDGALKYDSVSASNGDASITRFPLALTAHLLTNGSGGNSYFMAKAGIIRDFGVNLSVSGLGEADFQGHFGGTGALGYYGRSSDTFAWDFMGFFALTRHTIGTETVDANSLGITMGVHLNL